MRGLVAFLAFGTFVNLAVGWAKAPSGGAMAASGLAVPSPAPTWAMAESSSCRVVVVVSNSCPFCQQAAARASASDALVDRSTWVAAGAAEADSFRIAHPRLAVADEASAMSDLMVYGVPAAFLVRGDSVVAAWAFRGDESPEDLDRYGCRLDVQSPPTAK
jgi:hypothetical protein